MKLVFRFKRPHNRLRNRCSTTRWALEYTITEPNGAIEHGIAGYAYPGEGKDWVAHTERLQRSDCKTRKDAGDWIEAAFRSARGMKE